MIDDNPLWAKLVRITLPENSSSDPEPCRARLGGGVAVRTIRTVAISPSPIFVA